MRYLAMDLHNHFLNALSSDDLRLIRPSLERCEVSRDQILVETGHKVAWVYLPVNCVVSVVAMMKDGRSVETRTIGCESGIGLLHCLGSAVSYETVLAQIGGAAWRIPRPAMAAASHSSITLVQAIARHAQATLLQSAQSAACNILHTAEQRLARWLLLTRERLGDDVLPLTQEHLSIMLGVQRTTVTAVASEMQARGLVSYSRGRIRITDRPGLLARSCECYEAIERMGQRMLEEG